MKSKIAESIRLETHPVALIWADEAPAEALHFKKGRFGCVMSLLATVAARGKVAAFDRETYGCWGGGVGLGFGNRYEAFRAAWTASAGSLPTATRATRSAADRPGHSRERGEGVRRRLPAGRALREGCRTTGASSRHCLTRGPDEIRRRQAARRGRPGIDAIQSITSS
jgi:hypothetical protein